MNKITRLECEEIIDKLADKTLSFGCSIQLYSKKHRKTLKARVASEIYYPRGIDYDGKPFETTQGYVRPHSGGELEFYEVIGHPVMLGDVLNKLQLEHATINGWSPLMSELSQLWAKIAPSWSLQQILEEAEEEDGFMTQPAADLFIFLKKLA